MARNPDSPRKGESPTAWALRMAAEAFDEWIYVWMPAGAFKVHRQAARRLLKRLERERLQVAAKEARRG